jgi:translation initiation factor 1
MGKKSKKRSDVVYSTNPDFQFNAEEEMEAQTLSNNQQLLYVSIDRKQRKGKDVTLVEGFIGTDDDLKDLGKKLKSACGGGGTVKDGEILIQGNHRDKVIEILSKADYKTKRKGG